MTIQKTPLDIALEYIAAGHSPIPIPHKAKVPNVRGWQKLRITREAARNTLTALSRMSASSSAAHRGELDVDLDCAEAVAVAPYFLPKTNAIFGRASRRGSHYLYKTALAAAGVPGRKVFKDPLTKSTLIELRTGAGDGTDGAMQTVFPGSAHESGEPIEWEPGANGEPAFVDGDELQSAEGKAAAAALLARYWPSGGRHDAARWAECSRGRHGTRRGRSCSSRR